MSVKIVNLKLFARVLIYTCRSILSLVLALLLLPSFIWFALYFVILYFSLKESLVLLKLQLSNYKLVYVYVSLLSIFCLVFNYHGNSHG